MSACLYSSIIDPCVADPFVSCENISWNYHIRIGKVQYDEWIFPSLEDFDCLVCDGMYAHFSVVSQYISGEIRIKIICSDLWTRDHLTILKRILFLNTAVEELS